MLVLKMEMDPAKSTYTVDGEFIKVHGRRSYDFMMQGVQLRDHI